MLSHIRLFATPWTVAHQASLSTGFSRQKYWSGLPCPPPGDLPNPGIEPRSSALQADSSPSEPLGKPVWRGQGVVPASFFSFSFFRECKELLQASQFKFIGFQPLFLGYLPIQQVPGGAFRMEIELNRITYFLKCEMVSFWRVCLTAPTPRGVSSLIQVL